MHINFTYHGLVAPVFTPFHNDESKSLNLSVIPEYARFLVSKKINGVLVNGTTGEGPSLNINERKLVAEAWAEVCQETKQHLMVQVGGATLRDVKELASHAESIGADSILCLPELFYKPFGIEQVIEYLKEVGQSAPKTPLLYYHNPMMTSININIDCLFKAIEGKVPTFVGSKLDLRDAAQIMASNSRFRPFVAGDMLLMSGCALGIDSFIMTSLNFMPEPCIEILEFGRGNVDLAIARKKQDRMNHIIAEITKYGNWLECMKVAMNLTTNLFMGPPRKPNKLLSKEQIEKMADALDKLGLSTSRTLSMSLH